MSNTARAQPDSNLPPAAPAIPHHARELIFVGGSFDPPHLAHTELAMEARRAAGLESAWLLYVPAARNPLKDASPRASDENRLAMLELALQSVPQSTIWDDELARAKHSNGPSYTVDSLRRLRACLDHPVVLHLLLGDDQARWFHLWREPREIIELARPIVMLRETDQNSFASSMKETLFWSAAELKTWEKSVVRISRRDISSTRVRELLAATGRKDSPELAQSLSPAVLDYVRRNHLYGC